jgi:integrase
VRSGTSAPRAGERDGFLTWEDAVDLAETIHERYRALIYLAVDSGMRWSELVGLRRAKVDVHRGKVRVTEQTIRLESKEWLRKEPKTAAGVRSISICRETAAIVAEHVERFAAPGLDPLVFPTRRATR